MLPPLSLYIHMPWCLRKCPYCDFNSHQAKDIPHQQYIAALIEDLKKDRHLAQNRKIKTIFIGGGTPSLFSPSHYEQLFAAVDREIGIETNAEITLEANPGRAEYDLFNAYRAVGINRLSLGIQSFSNLHLQILGRVHNATEACKAIDNAQRAGFENLNLDLMFGLPKQTIEQGLQDLEKAISFSTSHLSWYQLTIEPNTEFYSTRPALPDDEETFQLQHQGMERLGASGFAQYEVSAFSKANFQCQHNLNYWQFGDYLAIGAGAHGKISFSKEGEDNSLQILRFQKTRLPAHYLETQKKYTARSNIIDRDNIPFEFMLNALRLKDGLETAVFCQRTGLTLQSIASNIDNAQQLGLLENSTQYIKPTKRGFLFLNDLVNLFTES